MAPRCQHCRKECKPGDLKKVELRESFNKKKASWSKPKKICLRCLGKKPINGNYRVHGLNVDHVVMERGKRRRQVSRKLTASQKAVLDFIIDYIEKLQRPPALKEISQHMGWSAVCTARDTIGALVKKGYLLREWHAWRGLSLNPDKYVVEVLRK